MRWIGLYEIPIDDPLLVKPGKLCGEDVTSGADIEGQVIFTGGGQEELWRYEPRTLDPGRGGSYHGLLRQYLFILTASHLALCSIGMCRLSELNERTQLQCYSDIFQERDFSDTINIPFVRGSQSWYIKKLSGIVKI